MPKQYSNEELTQAGREALQHLHPSIARYLGDRNTIQFAQGEAPTKSTTASVLPGRRTIYVSDPEKFLSDPLQFVAHEGIHLAQSRMHPTVQAKFPPVNPDDKYGAAGRGDYDALTADRAKGKTLAGMSVEEQGAIAQANAAQRQGLAKHKADGTLTPELEAGYRKSLAATDPYLQDMDKIPQSVMEPTDPEQEGINTKAMTPAVPAGVAGLHAEGEPMSTQPPAPVELGADEFEEAPAAGKPVELSADEFEEAPAAAPLRAPSPSIDMSKVAGATPGMQENPVALPTLKVRPQDALMMGSDLAHDFDTYARDTRELLKQGATNLIESRAGAPNSDPFAGPSTGPMIDASGNAVKPDNEQAALGAAQGIEGAMQIGIPEIPGEFMAASRLGKLKMVGGFLAGKVSSEGLQKAAQHFGFSGNVQRLAAALGWFGPGAAGIMASKLGDLAARTTPAAEPAPAPAPAPPTPEAAVANLPSFNNQAPTPATSVAPVTEGTPQPVGAKEPETDRIITQPTDKLAEAQKIATDAAPELKGKLESISDSVDGAKLAGVRDTKNGDRAREKAKKEDKPVETIPDLLAARISVDSPQAKEDIVAAIRRRFPIVKDEDTFKDGDPENGFRAHTLQVGNSNGSTAEVQVVPKEVLDVEQQTHGNYEKARTFAANGDDASAAPLLAKNKQIHDDAMDRFNQRNGIKKPKPVELQSDEFEEEKPSTKPLSDKEIENYAGAAKDIAKIAREVKAYQKKFLDDKGITMEQARGLDEEGRAKLQGEYEKWMKDNPRESEPKPTTPEGGRGESPEQPKGETEVSPASTTAIMQVTRKPNLVIRDVRDFSGKSLGVMTASYDGTEQGAMDAAERLSERMFNDHPNASNIQSRIGATGADGKPKWAISPNFKHLAEVGTDEARYVWGDLDAGEKPAHKNTPQWYDRLDKHMRNWDDDNPKTAGADEKTPAAKPAEEKPVLSQKIIKGMHVTLPNGDIGQVAFVGFGKARVTTLDGKKIGDFKPSELRPLSVRAGEEDGTPWIGVDMDGTLAKYDGFKGDTVIGPPIPAMVDRVKGWLKEGKQVRIMTARIGMDEDGTVRAAVDKWTKENFGQVLPVTNVKDINMTSLWDDRAVQVDRNTGKVEQGPQPEENGKGKSDVHQSEKPETATGQKSEDAGTKDAATDSGTDSGRTPAKVDDGEKPAEPVKKAPARKPSKAERDQDAAIADHFTPGNVILSNYWKKYDKVIAFHPATEGKHWSVDVVESDAEGNVQKGERQRNHSTSPDPKDKIVKRGEPVAQEPAKPADTSAPKVASEKPDFEKMGADAFKRGASSASAQDKDFYAAMNGLGSKEVMAAIDAWSKGWHNANLAEPVPGVPMPGRKTLSDHLYDAIDKDGMPKDNPALRKLVAEYDGVEPKEVTPVRMKFAQEALEVAIVRRARDIVRDIENPETAFRSLVKLYEAQPLLNVRTSTSIANQAYSTPAPLAFLADKLAGVDSKASLYEPTAGNGMLTIAANPTHTIVNELNHDRALNLREMGFRTVTEKDATAEDVVKPKTMDAVVTNPPFGPLPSKVSLDGYKIGQVDHLIAARALDAMKDDGKATLILGANKMPGGVSDQDRIFLNWLYGRYNVTGHFEMDGGLYDRQGAGWPVRVISIDGRLESSRIGPREGTIERVDTWEKVYEQFSKSLAAQGAKPAAVEPVVSRPVRESGSDEPKPVPVPTGTKAPAVDTKRPAAGETGDGVVSGRPAEHAGDIPRPPSSGVGSPDNSVRPDADVTESDRLPKGGNSNDSAGEKPARTERTPRTHGLEPEDNQYQVKYTPASRKKDEGVLIPTNMRQSLDDAMDHLQDQVGDLDKYVQKELGYKSLDEMDEAFMGLQTDAIAASIYQIQRGKAVIIADQTGIGKGREAAGVIRWAQKAGHIPIFFTKGDDLYSSMYSDLLDIGSTDAAPYLMNADSEITAPDGTKMFRNKPALHRPTLEKMRQTGKLPEGRNALFVTYSQINKENLQRDVLRALASKAIFILDESHNAGGESQTGEFIMNVLKDAKGVGYLSATYAKRPDNMPVYFKTDIGEAIGDQGSLIDAMKAGGLPLQTVVSNDLVKAGQYFRRERSYDGVEIRTVTDKENSAAHRKISDKATEALRAIVDADRAFHDIQFQVIQDENEGTGGGAIDNAGNQADAGLSHTEFSSVVHNFVKQMLLGLKADTAAEHAIAKIKAGSKPLIALENTMGSFLEAYIGDNNVKTGDPLTDFDYRTVLKRALDRTRRVTIKGNNGSKDVRTVPESELEPEVREKYEAAKAIIQKLEIDIPVSPIDWMRYRIEQAGYSVAEITGRTMMVDYSDPKKPTLQTRDPQEVKDKVETTRRFNDGRLDSIILNVAGSTGISLHASERFKDQRPRHMIIAQPASDINIFMQMLGRIHRTGQVALPGYTILNVDLPAEKRPNAILSGKMKSLNANTSSNTESATSVQTLDMLNKYGDDIVQEYLRENPKLALDLGLEHFTSDEDEANEGLARKATGRLALQPLKAQEQFYADVEAAYNDHIKYLNETGQNDLEARTIDFGAKLLPASNKRIFEGGNPNTPFGADAFYGEYTVKSQGKPMTAEEVNAEIAAATGGKSGGEYTREIIKATDERFEKYLKTLDKEDGDGMIRAEGIANSGRNALNRFQVGEKIKININDDHFNAVVTDLKVRETATGNPYSPSKIKVTLAIAGSLRHLSIPETQLEKIYTDRIPYSSIENIFNPKYMNMSTTAKIITGNKLAAYGRMVAAHGRIVTFTKDDGTTDMGILMPNNFNVEEGIAKTHQMRDPQAALTFLKNGQNRSSLESVGLQSADGNVRILATRNGDLKIQTPKSKARGGKFFLNKDLIAITGDFVSSGNFMTADVPRSRELEAVQQVIKMTPIFAPASLAEEAQAMANKATLGRPAGSGGKLYSGAAIIDPEAWSHFFPDVADRFNKWASDAETPGDMQKANMRETRGEMDRKTAIVQEALAKTRKQWSLRSKDDSIAFFNAVESGNLDSLQPGDRAMARAFTQKFDDMKAALQQLNPHILQDYIENYFPHIWEHGSKAKDIITQVARGKRPFAGKGSFLKQRTVPTIQDGLDMGLTPVSWNPVDLFLLKYHEQAQFLMAHKTFAMMKEDGTAKFVKLGKEAPDGWIKLDDRFGTVMNREENGDMILRGHYYAPPDAGKIFNNYVSRGFAGRSALFDGVRAANNNMNALQLGISLFHATTTSVNAAVSDAALGIQEFSQGKVISGASHLASGLAIAPAVVRNYITGSRMMKEYLRPGSYLKLSNEAHAVTRAGGRAKQDHLEMRPFDQLVQRLRMQKWNEPYSSSAAAKLFSGLIDISTRPIMDHFVPRMKLGAFYSMAHNILDTSGKEGWSDERTRARVQQAWDSVDNRFGQMVHDNLFWHKMLRDSLQVTTRSVGWNMGTIRELGGAVLDLPREAAKAAGAGGESSHAEVTDRMAFAIALPIVTAVLGGTIYYLLNGKQPQTWKDYYYPNGTSLPGYMKDVFAWGHDPVQTAKNKLAPIMEMTSEAMQNRDFYGTEIRHPDDPVVKQLGQMAKFVGSQYVPFSVRGSLKLADTTGSGEGTIGDKLRNALKHPGALVSGQLGFQQAPAWIRNSPAMNAARDYEHQNFTPGTRTQQQADKSTLMHAVEGMYRDGKVDQAAIDRYVKEGTINQHDVLTARMRSRVDPLAQAAASLHIDQLLKVFEKADDREKAILRPKLIQKSKQINEEKDPEARAALREAYQRAVGAPQQEKPRFSFVPRG